MDRGVCLPWQKLLPKHNRFIHFFFCVFLSYTLNGQPFHKEVYQRPFGISLDRPGELIITSIAHQGVRKNLPKELFYSIHPLPAAYVARGRVISQDITAGIISFL